MKRLGLVWILLAFGVVLLAVTAYDAHQRGNDRERTIHEIHATQRKTCDGLNLVRSEVRGILARAVVRQRELKTLTPTAERFYRDSIADLANVDCTTIRAAR